jgi:hypothetical protein
MNKAVKKVTITFIDGTTETIKASQLTHASAKERQHTEYTQVTDFKQMSTSKNYCVKDDSLLSGFFPLGKYEDFSPFNEKDEFSSSLGFEEGSVFLPGYPIITDSNDITNSMMIKMHIYECNIPRGGDRKSFKKRYSSRKTQNRRTRLSKK